MVNRLSIGVIGIQGAISEHINIMNKTLNESGVSGNVVIVKTKDQIKDIDALILPGGESSTISKILFKSGISDEINKRLKEKSLPIMGTCSGCVMLANKITNDVKDVKLLFAMDMSVKRNAFGRQRESFETNIKVKGFHDPYNAVFIRAPVIEEVWGDCEIIAKSAGKIVMAKQGNLLALSFHPELTDDLRIHKYFLDMIRK